MDKYEEFVRIVADRFDIDYERLIKYSPEDLLYRVEEELESESNTNSWGCSC